MQNAEMMLKDAAHLIAAILDPLEGIDMKTASPDVRDTVEALRDQLGAAGLLDAYALPGGGVGLWAN